MLWRLKVRRVGGHCAAILPDDLMAALRLEQDEEVFAATTADGVLLVPADPGFVRSMAAFDVVHKRFHRVFGELAK